MYLNRTFSNFAPFPGDMLPLVGVFRTDLVVLSVAIAICGAWAALACLPRADALAGKYPGGSMLWRVAGGVAFGGAVWGMHFVGMLAFSLPCAISYDILETTLSIVPGILASLSAMAVLGWRSVGLYTRLATGAVLMGAGIGAMHYAGMAAMRLPALLMYDPAFVLFSVVTAVVMSFVALLVVERGRRDKENVRLRQLVAATILGSAVASMHYVAMQAAIFYPTLNTAGGGGALSPTVMAAYVGLGTLILAAAVTVAAFAARLKETARVLAEEVEHRIAAEKQARAEQTRLQAIFDTAVEAIVVIDGRGAIQRWSASAERIFGYAADEVIGRNVAMIMDGISVEQHDRYLKRYQETREARIVGIGREVTGRRRDGTAVPLELSVGEAIIDGEVLYTGILRDISQRKAIERELREAIRAKEANELKSNFLAHMSHEMRTPLNAILGFSDIMKSQTFGPLGETYAGYANDIFSSGNHLLNLVNALLDLAKIENNKQDIDVSDIDLRSILQDTVSLLREQAKAKNLVVSTLIDNDVPNAIHTDRGKLYQILVNLLGNAVKYTGDGGRVSVRAWPRGDDVEILIEDNGIGMTDDEVELALKPFGQIKNAFTSDVAGTGLGLPIVVSFLELLNGSIKIKSRKGEGTTVRITVPVNDFEPPAKTSDAYPV